MTHGGHGLARLDGQVCFVPGALPGDVVDLHRVRKHKGVHWGDVARVVRASSDRIVADCPVFGRCGGCSWLHFAYPAQGEWKRRMVEEAFRRLARIEVAVVLAEDPAYRFHYRTRARFHGDGACWGFFAEASHDVVDIVACPLLHPFLNTAFAKLRETDFRGEVEITVHPETGETLVWTHAIADELRRVFPSVECRQSNTRSQFLFDGAPIVNGTFSQSSLLLNRLLVSRVRDLAAGAKRVIDLYCGSGNFSLGFADSAEVIGIDHNYLGVSAAAKLGKGEYICGNEDLMARTLGEAPWDVVILDPPRTGAKAIVPALASTHAGRIIYVSCDPATLARDAAQLAGQGWRIDNVTAVDMFPFTCHVEVICVFSRL
ncbi:MAG: putative RNA methyltransferase [Candidatus Hydrogenedentota bacterium]